MAPPSRTGASPPSRSASVADTGEDTSTSHTTTDHQDRPEKTVLVLGNLNVGKTTLFNRVCGKRLRVSNYPGTSVSVGRGSFSEAGAQLHLIDTPGIDSMMPESEHEKISRDILLDEKPDIIAQVADGKNLRKSLLLTLQLAEFGTPLILDINMMDEAAQRGIRIDRERLSSLLGVPVTETVATEGKGVGSFRKALTGAGLLSMPISYPARIASAISAISRLLEGSDLPPAALGTALLAGDTEARCHVLDRCGVAVAEQADTIAGSARAAYNRPLSAVILEARLRVVDEVLSEVQSVSPPARTPFSEKIGEIMKHVSEEEADTLQTSYKFYM